MKAQNYSNRSNKHNICMCIHTHACTHSHTHTRMHACTCTHIHTHTHTAGDKCTQTYLKDILWFIHVDLDETDVVARHTQTIRTSDVHRLTQPLRLNGHLPYILCEQMYIKPSYSFTYADTIGRFSEAGLHE